MHYVLVSYTKEVTRGGREDEMSAHLIKGCDWQHAARSDSTESSGVTFWLLSLLLRCSWEGNVLEVGGGEIGIDVFKLNSGT